MPIENTYFLILADQNLRPLKSRFKELGAFYTGIGYAVPVEKEKEIRSLCETAGLKLYNPPIPSGQTFEAFEQSHKAHFFREQLANQERKIGVLKDELDLKSYEYSELKSYPGLNEMGRGQQLLDLIEECETIKNQLTRAENFERALNQPLSTKPQVKFISQLPVNLLSEDAPEYPTLVSFQDGDRQRPFLRRGILAMLVGAGGVGKTIALTQLALSIATGYPWFGLFPIEKPGYVFLGLGENSSEDIHRLLRKIYKPLKNTFAHNPQFFDRDPLQAASERIAPMSFSGINAAFINQGNPTPFFNLLLSALKESEPEEGWSCIILDPISRFIGLDAETDNASATQFIALLERMTMELKGNPTVIFGHHMNKSGVSGQNTDQAAARGSSAITDGVRWQVNLERAKSDSDSESDPQTEVIFRHVKSNFTAILKKQILRKDESGCLYSDNPITRHIPTNSATSLFPASELKKGYVKIGDVRRS